MGCVALAQDGLGYVGAVVRGGQQTGRQTRAEGRGAEQGGEVQAEGDSEKGVRTTRLAITRASR